MPTPLIAAPTLKTALGLNAELFLKREDLHPYHSNKGRSIPYMIDLYIKEGAKNFVISSSGNAALAALIHIKKYNETNPKNPCNLEILLGEKINAAKLARINSALGNAKNIFISRAKNPKQIAFEKEKLGKKLLRQSTDDTALIGYEDLAKELVTEVPNLSAIFIPTSSGTTAQGLFEGFKKLNKNPEIHIVQTEAVHPFVNGPVGTTPSTAGAIVDKVGHRKIAIAEVLKESQGNGYIATNSEIEKALLLAKQTLDFEISPNSALALVGLQKAMPSGKKWSGSVVLLVTGQ